MLGRSWGSGGHPQTPLLGIWWSCHPCWAGSSPHCCCVCSGVRPADRLQRGAAVAVVPSLSASRSTLKCFYFFSQQRGQWSQQPAQLPGPGRGTARPGTSPQTPQDGAVPGYTAPRWRPRPRRVVDSDAGVIHSSMDEHLHF